MFEIGGRLKVNVFIVLMLMFAMDSLAYNVASGDVLHLGVYGEPELTMDVTVNQTGYIEYPFIGKINVAGSTLESIKQEVVNKLKDGYFINPQFTISIKAYKPFFIQGEVESPGSYPYEDGLTVRKAIALAGGLTERASEKKIYITRAVDESHSQIKTSMNEEIFSGDVILIKESFF